MHTLGNELKGTYSKVLLTSLTKASRVAPHPVIYMSDINGSPLDLQFQAHNPLYLMHRGNDPEKLKGLTERELSKYLTESEVVICECDGSRNLPLKQHLDHDPIAPPYSTHVIVVVGADAVGTTLSDGLVHRSAKFADIWGINGQQKLDAHFIASVVTSKRGYLAKVRENQKVTFFVNKADSNWENALSLANTISAATGSNCYYGSLLQGKMEYV